MYYEYILCNIPLLGNGPLFCRKKKTNFHEVSIFDTLKRYGQDPRPCSILDHDVLLNSQHRRIEVIWCFFLVSSSGFFFSKTNGMILVATYLPGYLQSTTGSQKLNMCQAKRRQSHYQNYSQLASSLGLFVQLIVEQVRVCHFDILFGLFILI